MQNSGGEQLPLVVLFDYGGVLAEEGFMAGLKAIAAGNGLEPDDFFRNATEIIYECGYVIGRATAAAFWNGIRERYRITGDDEALTREIHTRFILRPGMMAKVRALQKNGVRTAILSDQTDWLEMLDQRDHFLAEFSPVLNSFHLGITKRDPEVFAIAEKKIKVPAERILFVDDNPGHIGRAREMGFAAHLFTAEEDFGRALAVLGLISSGEGE
ncbi:MAG: HAD family phosphatase [Proteobacteria bacterium]|nr:HAD family phosphatase [Pseudomonadota bacterium]MBU1739685.1 HAD family phosphatase [Pseudomonadota bacterium]